MLFVMMRQGASVYRGPQVHLSIEPSDADGAWTLELVDGEPPRPARGTSPGGPGAVALTGPAGTLLLFLWGRLEADAVPVEGDEAATAALVRWMKE